MTDQDKVRSVVARFFSVPEATVSDAFVFPPERLHGSVGRATFRAAIKRMAGVDLPSAATATTFHELFAAVPSVPSVGGALKYDQAYPLTPANTKASATLDAGIGIDIEHCDHLPVVADPWTETFYTDNFTAAEIAYCQRRPNPRESFCGIWCAKEAAIKSCQDFADRRPKELEIQWNTQGQPSLVVVSGGKPEAKSNCRISISHAHGLAVAVCVAGWGKIEGLPTEPWPAAINSTSRPERRTLSWLALGLGILNLLFWIVMLMKK